MIGIISAMYFEMQGVLKLVTIEKKEEICELDFYLCNINGKRFVISACGEGKVNAARCAQIMISCFKVIDLINIGVAGGLSAFGRIGQLIVASSLIQYDFDLSGIGFEKGLVPRGKRDKAYPAGDKAAILYNCSDKLVKIIQNTLEKDAVAYDTGIIATGDKFVSDDETKNYLFNHFHAIACDMEGAALAHVCMCGGIGFAELRKISDNADENANVNYFKAYKQYKIEELAVNIIERYYDEH